MGVRDAYVNAFILYFVLYYTFFFEKMSNYCDLSRIYIFVE